jgi:sugar transferase (PEP-CTERM/EpsH1 system associated)
MADYVKCLEGERKILAIEDPLSLYYERSLPYRGMLPRLFYQIESRRVSEYEQKIGRHFHHCLVVSPSDKELLEQSFGYRNLVISPHGVDVDFFSPQYAPVDELPSIVFSGNMGYYPNIDAVLYLRTEIMPWIWKTISEIRLTIVGANPAAAVRRLARDPRVTVTGSVMDIRPYFRNATVAVCPLRIGAGIQNKILEAMAMGVPVVASPLATDGIRLQSENHALLATDAEAFSRQIIRVVTDPELGHRLSKNGRKFVEERYDWTTNLQALETVFFASNSTCG